MSAATSQRPREQVTIESIRIGRAPGIDGVFTLSDLGPGITVIHGPNGSGKSTTARSIHSLLWPEPVNDGCLVEATIRYDGCRWTIRRDGASVRCQRDGLDHPPLNFPHLTPDTRDRYHLALHDLLRADDSAFAAYVTREASGGFDLESAAAALKFSSVQKSHTHAAKALTDAFSAYRQAVQKQEALKREEAELASLESERERATQAGITIHRLNAIAEALAARAELDEAIAACHRYDTGIAHVTTDHARVLAEWREQEPLLRQKLADLDGEITRERQRMAGIGLPLDKDCVRDIRFLDVQFEELRTTEEAQRAAAINVATGRQHVQALQARVGPNLPESLQTEQAIALLRRYEEALNRQDESAQIGAAEAQLAAWMPRPAGNPDPERMQHALRVLAAWLQTPPLPAESPALDKARMAALIAALLVIAEAILLGIVWHSAGFALAVVGLTLGIWALTNSRATLAIDERVRVQEDFLRLGLPAPESWTEQDVADHFTQTLRDAVAEQAAAKDADRWRSLAPALERRHQARIDALERKEQLEAEMGTELALDRPALATLTDAMEDWLKASAEQQRLERNHALLLEAEQTALATFNVMAGGLGAKPAMNGKAAKAVLGDLKDRLAQMQEAARAIEQASTQRTSQVAPALERIAQGRAAMIERYGGRPLGEIEILVGQFDAYQQALQLVRSRRDRFESRCARLDRDIRLPDWTSERVVAEIAHERAIEQQAADVNQRIGAINQSIKTAKSRDDVATALFDVEKARDALRERRDDHLLKTAGALLLESVRRETREANLPVVARRAREIFAEITHGRYRLNFNPGPPASFTATDTTTGGEHALDQLSSGTRVQLLIAVRTAFVEASEQDASLPMIFDETLANADGARAEALIAATFRLCAAGRQVIYFTAQYDEVEKWVHLAAEQQTDIRVIDLADARKLDALTRPALADLAPIERPAFPAPNGHTRSGYRRVLGAPPLNLWSIDGGDIHLWHLTDDLAEIHRLVTGANVSRWGQVRELTIDGASPALGLDREAIERMAARADACIALIEAARIGRGRRVSRQDLLDSNGVTSRFADRCLDLLEECGGDAERFLECLANRAILGFRSDNIDRFRDYFEANGHIVADTPLTPDDVRISVARRMTGDIAAGRIDLDTIDRLMSEAFLTAEAVEDALADEAAVLSGVN